MGEPSIFHDIISGEAGAWALPLRAGLRVLELGYSAGIRWRNARYDRRGPAVTLPIPVVSVGNLTAGGTGKTPFVMEVVNRLERKGFSPAVVSRGYKAVPGEPNDEELLIRKRCPGVVYVADPDRAAAAMVAQERYGADVIVLDDGFQHRRLARTLDIVLVDATCAFGYDHLLPRGLLREAPQGLRRAHAVVLTRVDQASPAERERVGARVRRLAPDAAYLESRHAVTSIERLDGTAVTEPLDGRRAVVFAGIGRPGAFLTTVRMLGVDVVGRRWWPDHHRYRRGDVEALLTAGRFPSYDWLMTTEKDAVKLALLGGWEHAPIAVVKASIEFLCNGAESLDGLLAQRLS